MKNTLICLVLSSSCFAQLNVPLTVQEALIPGTNGFSGLARTNDPLTVGVPLPDSAGITSTSVLGLTGASAGQFTPEARWPDGNIKWLKIRAIIPSVSAGGTATITLTSTGAGNFGGSNLATDNGSTITVATGTATFTIKKANFNVIDQAVVGPTTVVSSGSSMGLVVEGPSPAAAYPGNVTCSPTSGGTACTTVYASSNDSASTCMIEENGPAVAVLKCTADLIDSASHTYMHTTTREYFYRNRSQAKYTVVLRNADYGTSGTFATASKGYQGFELRIKPNISGSLTYTFANGAGTATNGTMSGTDYTYLYQAESNLAKPTSWCAGYCNPPSTISGYAILKNGTAILTGAASQYPAGWADIANSAGVGVLIGQDQLAAYGNKSLEFRGGGTDVRVGMWASENNTTGPATTTANAPYYAPWPQWSIQNGWLEFHTAAPSSPANDHLMLQYPLLARASTSWYNSAAVFPFPLLDPIEEDNYYSTTLSAAVPAVLAVRALDSAMGNTSISNQTCDARGGGAVPTVCIYRYWSWAEPGGSNQMEFRLSGLYNFFRRGFTGQYMNSAYWYKFVAEDAFPMSDGFAWTSYPSQTQYYGYPTAASANYALSIAGSGGQSRLNIEDDMEHGNAQGYDTFYLLSGDETIKDSYMEAVPPFFANNSSVNNYTGLSGALWVDRSVGNLFKWAAHLYTFLNSVGDSTHANAILSNAETVFTTRIRPNFCAYPGYPAGCTPDYTDSIPQVGQSQTRGMTNIFKDTSLETVGCSGAITTNPRTNKPFMASRKLEGMMELYQVLPSSWAYRNQFWDYVYGGAQWAFGEMMMDNASSVWTGNGFRYAMAVDYPNACNTDDWANLNNETVWYHWTAMENYLGPLTAAKVREFNYVLAANSSNGNTDEFYHDTMATAIYYILHPQATTLRTISVTSFTDNGGGSYTIGWTTPPSTTGLRVKWGTKQIVDWIGFNAGTYSWIGNPATTQNWFASTDAAGIPAPVAGSQNMTISTGTTGLTAANFMVKAYVASSGSSAPPPPSISITAPANGTSVAGTVMVSANASDSLGIVGVQFKLDGSTLGGSVTGAGPSFNFSWNTATASNGSHLVSAVLTDTAGNTTASGAFSVTVNNTAVTSSGGTPIPLNTWSMIPATGWPAEILNYDKSEYISSRKLHCVWGAYKQWLSSEHNNAIVCYSYSENRWQVLENNGYWHASHAPGVGHSVSAWAYISDKDTIAFQADGSGSNSPEEFIGLWWWYDVAGLSGQDREFSPRPWVGVATPLVEMLTYDPYDQKLFFYDKNGAMEICDPNTNACSIPPIGGTAPPKTLTSPNMVYNSTNHQMYIFGGGQAGMYTLACGTNACTALTGEKLAVTCTGTDCTNGAPPARLAAGMAYSSVDHVFMMVGGLNFYGPGDAAFNDTWIFNPASLTWTELSPAGNYADSAAYFTADRLTYDQDSNTFIVVAVNGYTPIIYAYPYSAALNYGRVSNTYTPPAGSQNRVQPTATSQSWVFDPVITASNGVVYAGWIETGAGSDNSVCGQSHHPYIQSSPNNGVWTGLPAGAQAQACLAIDPDLSGDTNDSKLRLAVVKGTLWEAHEKINHNQAFYSSAFANYWSGSSWTGGAVGCFSGTCGANLRQNPQSLIAVGNVPTLAAIEQTHSTYTPEGYIYVAQWNGSAWTALGPKLNINGTGTQALDAALATDGTNPAVCWSEQVVASDRGTVTTTPQIQCGEWNGSSWARFGMRSLNQNGSSWAYDPTMTWVGGKFYIGWVERTTAGFNQLYVCRWDGSSCTLLGGGALNLTPSTGWASHPSLSNDGTNVYVAWEEQATLGQHSMGYVKKWNGSSWSQVGSAVNADPVNGSVEGLTLTVEQGMPTAIWGELSYGNLRQAYVKQWNGSIWSALGGAAPPPLTCDLNGDGTINAADIQIATNQALGISPCTNADLLQNGQCSVIDVQRVINASLGGACRIGP